jgi:hypothetical protein
MGRPRIYQTPEELDELVDAYLQYCKDEKKKPSTTGAAIFLGFSDKCSLYDYEKRDGFSHSIKRLLLHVENGHEENLYGNSVTGSIFALKNMGWKDKVENIHGADDETIKQLVFVARGNRSK